MEYQFKQNGTFGIQWPVHINLNYFNLHHDPFTFNMSDFEFKFEYAPDDVNHEKALVYIKLPLIKHFEVDFDYKYRLLGLGHSGHSKVEFNNSVIIAAVNLMTTSKGHIYPELREMYLDIRNHRFTVYNSWMLTNFYY